DVLPDAATQQAVNRLELFVQVQHDGLHELAASVVQQLARQGRRALDRMPYVLDPFCFTPLCLQIVRDQFDVAGDDGEQVVEVVGNAAGQAGDGIHLL